jgi:hypothetical protein
MPKYLRRRSDGMVFGYNVDMAKNPELEEVDLSEGEASEPVDPNAEPNETTEQKAARQLALGSDAFQGYPSKGYAPTRDAPFGKNKPKHGTNKEGTVANPAPDPAPEPPKLEGFFGGGEVDRGDGTPHGLPDVNPGDEEGVGKTPEEEAEEADISFEPARNRKKK